MDEKRIRSYRRNLRTFERLNQLTNTLCCKGITLAQCHVLLEIEALNETTTKQLAENLRLDKSTLSRTVDGLTKRGLVKRGDHTYDRRFTVLRLTKAGQAKCDSLNRFNDTMYGSVFGSFSQRDQKSMFQAFDHMVQAMSRYCRDTGTC